MSAARTRFLCRLILGASLMPLAPEADAIPPPSVCEIRQATWCIHQDDVTIQHAPASEPGYGSVWKIWGPYWAEHPLVILEPRGCRVGLSDTLQLVDHTRRFSWSGRAWDSVDVRLKVDGSCDLRLLSPIEEVDPRQSAFAAKLTQLQSCTTSSCTGVVFSERIWDLLREAP